MRLFQPLMIVMLAAGSQVAANEPMPTDGTANARSAQPLANGPSTFDQLDLNRDGWLTEQEADAEAADPGVDFSAADRDNDRRLSSEEWKRRDEPTEQ